MRWQDRGDEDTADHDFHTLPHAFDGCRDAHLQEAFAIALLVM